MIVKYFRAFLIFVLCSSFYFCSKENKTESQGNKEPIKSESSDNELKVTDDFIVNYDLTGKINGKMTIYREGNKLKQSINSEIMGIKNKNEIYVLDNFVFSITDIGDKKFGVKTSLEDYNDKKKTGETITDFTQFEKFLEGKQVIGTENILGYSCDIYDIGNGLTISAYNKMYILKIKTQEFVAVATTLDKNPSFKVDEFEVPANVDFKNISPQGKKNEILDSLLKDYKK